MKATLRMHHPCPVTSMLLSPSQSARPQTSLHRQALRQNLRTPKSFHLVRQEAVTVVEDVCSIWNLEMSNVYVGGFSQGAMLVSDLVVAVPRPLAGAVMLSGAPVGRSEQRTVSSPMCTSMRRAHLAIEYGLAQSVQCLALVCAKRLRLCILC